MRHRSNRQTARISTPSVRSNARSVNQFFITARLDLAAPVPNASQCISDAYLTIRARSNDLRGFCSALDQVRQHDAPGTDHFGRACHHRL